MNCATTRLALVLLVAAGCASPVPDAPADAAADTAAIARQLDAAYDRFTEGYATANAGLVADQYTEDALYLPPGGSILRGRDTIRANFERFLGPFRAQNRPGPNISFEIVERRIDGDLAYDIGYYRFDGERAGKFTVIWRRDADGVWRIHSDGYNNVGSGG